MNPISVWNVAKKWNRFAAIGINPFHSGLNSATRVANALASPPNHRTENCQFKKKGLKYFEDTSNLVALSKDFLSAYYAFFYLGCHYTWSCGFSKAQLNFNKCIELSTAANNPIGVSNPKALAAYAYCYNGQIEKAYTLVEEGVNAAEQNGHLFCKMPAYSAYGIYFYYKGIFSKGG